MQAKSSLNKKKFNLKRINQEKDQFIKIWLEIASLTIQ